MFSIFSKPKLSTEATFATDVVDDIYLLGNLMLLVKYIEKLSQNPQCISQLDRKLIQSLDSDFTSIISQALKFS